MEFIGRNRNTIPAQPEHFLFQPVRKILFKGTAVKLHIHVSQLRDFRRRRRTYLMANTLLPAITNSGELQERFLRIRPSSANKPCFTPLIRPGIRPSFGLALSVTTYRARTSRTGLTRRHLRSSVSSTSESTFFFISWNRPLRSYGFPLKRARRSGPLFFCESEWEELTWEKWNKREGAREWIMFSMVRRNEHWWSDPSSCIPLWRVLFRVFLGWDLLTLSSIHLYDIK